MTWTVWLGALSIGLVLGLLGSGGSILAVPVLVYLVGEPEKLAIAESLGVVALISLIGVIPFAFRKQVDWQSVVFFGIPGMAGAYLGAYLSQFLSGATQLALFAGVMLLAAFMMIRVNTPKRAGAVSHAPWKIVLEGLTVGVLTGLVGVGGGFLIVPALVLLNGLSMHLAIGTSLAIIALKSISGFYKYLDVMAEADLAMHWNMIFLFGGIGVIGSLMGGKAGAYVSQRHLRKGFALFLLVMGVYILWQNLPAALG